MERSYEYLMSDRYCREWTIPMAIRELVSNAFDAAKAVSKPINEEVEATWGEGFGSIRNKSLTLQKINLLFGESDKTDGQIGQFGEGLKISALVISRNGGIFEIRSGDTVYTFRMKYSEDFGVPLLVVTLSASPEAVSGTVVRFQCTREDFSAARDMFMEYNAPVQVTDKVLEAQGDVYILGVKVSHVEKAAFGYHLDDKTLMNRDRTVVDQSQLSSAIRRTWTYCDKPEAVESLLSRLVKDRTQYEGGLTMYSTATPWKPVVTKMFGEKACIRSTDDQANERAKYLGFTVLDFGDGINSTLCYQGMCRAHEVALEEAHVVSRKSLTVEQRKCLDAAKRQTVGFLGLRKGDEMYALVMKVQPAKLPSDVKEQVDGKTREIWVSESELSEWNVSTVAASIVHALAHIHSHGPDCSSLFEWGLTQMVERAISHRRNKR